MMVKEPRTAATVVLLRDTPGGLETLMLKRNKALMFAGGVWVFPGGSLDPSDWEYGAGEEVDAARAGAAREAMEESGLEVDPDTMVQISHWTTPEAEPKRFYTWFFLAMAPADPEVEIDGSEIHDHAWMNVAEAVQQHEAGDFGLFPPTIMTLRALQGYLSAEDALIGTAAREPVSVFPVFAVRDKVVDVLFEGDAGYGTVDGGAAGPRHRVTLREGCWHYQHEGTDRPRLDGR